MLVDWEEDVVAEDCVDVRVVEEVREVSTGGSADAESLVVDSAAKLLLLMSDVLEGGGDGGVMGCQISVSTSNIQISLKHSPPSLPPSIISLLPTMFAVW